MAITDLLRREAPRAARPMDRSLTAAGQQLDPTNKAQAIPSGGEPWQKLAWDFYDQVGELHYANSFFTSCARRVKLRIALRDNQGNITTAWDDTGKALHPQADQANEYLRNLRPAIGGHGELLAAMTGNLGIAGEGYIVGELQEGQAEPSSWEVLSVEELVYENGRYKKLGTDNKKSDLVAAEDPIRFWRSHQRHSQKADSSVRPLLDVLEEIVLLTRGVRATTLSRLAGAGILAMPSEIDYPTPEDAPPDTDQFVIDLLTHMTTPIKDKGSAAAVAPFVVRVPGDRIAQIKHFDFTRNFDSYPSVALRSEAIQRLAQGLDLPVEIITGQGGTNHWSAWQIDESTFKAHIEPVLEIEVDALTDWLENRLGERTIQNGLEVIVHYDANELVSHPNEAADFAAAHSAFIVSDARYRQAIGASDRDAPDDEEVIRRLEIERAKRGPAPGIGGDPAQGADEVVAGPPAAALSDLTQAGIDVAVERAVERFGARVRSKLNGNTAVRAAIDGVDNRSVAMALGPTRIGEMWKPHELFPGEFHALRRVATEVAKQQGHPNPAGWAEFAVSSAEELAEARLYDPTATIDLVMP